MMSGLVYCPFPTIEEARSAAHALLDAQLIACANILGTAESIYEWNGERESSQEIAVLFKTKEALLGQCVELLGTLHSYDSPTIIAWACEETHPSTQLWLSSLGAENL